MIEAKSKSENGLRKKKGSNRRYGFGSEDEHKSEATLPRLS